jgi:hypothetical protein
MDGKGGKMLNIESHLTRQNLLLQVCGQKFAWIRNHLRKVFGGIIRNKSQTLHHSLINVEKKCASSVEPIRQTDCKKVACLGRISFTCNQQEHAIFVYLSMKLFTFRSDRLFSYAESPKASSETSVKCSDCFDRKRFFEKLCSKNLFEKVCLKNLFEKVCSKNLFKNLFEKVCSKKFVRRVCLRTW